MMYAAYKLNNQGDNIQPWHTPFPIWNRSAVPCPVLFFFPMSSSNCCFLTWIQISGYRYLKIYSQVGWYSYLLKNFPQFIVIHTVKGFEVVNKPELDVSLELFCFFDDPADFGNLISCSSAFTKTSLKIWNSWFMYCWSPSCKIWEIFY